VRHDSPAIIAQTRARLEQPESDGTRDNDRETLLLACGAMHDRACVRRVNAALVDGRNPEKIVDYASAVQQAYSFLGAWDAVVTLGPAAEREYSSVAPPMWGRAMQIREVTPFMAEAAAHLGQFQKAHALADQMPPDSSPCLVVRGEIRALEHKWAPAAFWFAKASTIGAPDPSIPTEWGRMLMMKRDYDGAIAKFSIANRKGPHFADPLEMWGEALIAKNRSDLALAKFEEANKYAPNWGRLHLKWGEALLWSGDHAAAQKQFALAARLDLTPSEKNLLAKVGAHG
jgi:tetratricopeptide (TPR) repeat protein